MAGNSTPRPPADRSLPVGISLRRNLSADEGPLASLAILSRKERGVKKKAAPLSLREAAFLDPLPGGLRPQTFESAGFAGGREGAGEGADVDRARKPDDPLRRQV
jgi:hypothetical protein